MPGHMAQSSTSPLGGRSHPSSSTSTPGPQRRTRDNIEDILETARRRSEALAQSGTLPPGPLRAATIRLSPEEAQRLQDHEDSRQREEQGIERVKMGHLEESSADEATAIFRGRKGRQNSDYGAAAPSKLRSRNSQQSQSQPVHGEPGNGARQERGSGPRAQTADGPETEEGGEDSWWKRQLAKYGSLELENKGSVARDHLALERTFLAWLRTSLAFASIGIAITQLFRLNTALVEPSNPSDSGAIHFRSLGKPIGATFVGISIVVLFVGFHRYFESQHWIIRGKFPASRGSIALIALIAFLLMVVSLVVVLVVEPRQFEQ